MAPDRIVDELRFKGDADIRVASLEHGLDLIACEPGVDQRAARVTLELRQQAAVLAEAEEELGQTGLLCRLSHRQEPKPRGTRKILHQWTRGAVDTQ